MSQGPELRPGPASGVVHPPPAPAKGATLGLWAGVGLAVVLLAGSAAARAWQSRRVDEVLRDGRVAPFKLSLLPKQIGPWTGVDTELDPEIARITGGTEIVTRYYRHRTTGQTIALIFLFGPSTDVFGHSPEVCYPANGCMKATGPDYKMVTEPRTGAAWPFFSAVYVKGEGGLPIRKEVYWTWRFAGQWNPALASYKGFERIPGMFKVHIDRVVKSREEMDLLGVGNPCEAFLSELMPEIDRMLAESAAAPKKAAPR